MAATARGKFAHRIESKTQAIVRGSAAAVLPACPRQILILRFAHFVQAVAGKQHCIFRRHRTLSISGEASANLRHNRRPKAAKAHARIGKSQHTRRRMEPRVVEVACCQPHL